MNLFNWFYNKSGYNRAGYDKKGYDREGYDKNGYTKDGYDREGYNKDGFDRNGYNREGYNKFGYDLKGYNQEGYDKEGYDRNGYNRDGYDRSGYNREGYNKFGYDLNGYNKDGYNQKGYNKEGYSRDGFDREGYDKTGFNINGYDRCGYNKAGYNEAGFDREGYNKAGYNKEGYDQKGYNKEGYDKEGYNRNGFNKNGYDKHGFNKMGYNAQGLNRHGYNREGYNKEGYNKEGYNKRGYDKNGYNKEGYDQDGYDQEGYDKDGYNKNGVDKNHNSRYNLVIGQSIYHITYGIGTFMGFESDNRYIRIKFVSEGELLFQYPNSLGTFLFVEKPAKMVKREKMLNDSQNNLENMEEIKHFENICKIIDVSLTHVSREYELIKYSFNDYNSDGPSVFSQSSRLHNSFMYYQALRNEPFFARIDYIKKNKMYIGKKEIKNEVVDWADPICSLYYEYQMYIGNPDYELTLVREFDIAKGKYYGFENIYSRHDVVQKNENIENAITDSRLLKIIKSKENKQVHDIIATIQANQYQIITSDISNNLIVLGCAGSGKTMVMFHRLRYLLRNNKELDIRNVYLISPTGLLNSESNDLSMTLQIEKANKLSTIQFNTYIVKSYYDLNKSYVDVKEKVTSNEGLQSEFIKEVYSKISINKMAISLHAILRNKDNERLKFIEKENKKIISILYELTNINYNNLQEIKNEKDKLYYIYISFYYEACQELKGISEKNITDMITSMSGKGESGEYKILILKELLKLDKKFIGKTTKVTKKGDIYIDESCLKSVFKLFKNTNWYGGKNRSSKYILKDENPILFFKKYSQIIERINALIDFTEGNDNAYLFNIIQSIINEQKMSKNISISHFYEYELFIHLCLCQNTFGPLGNDKKIIFIDEFQDFAYTELAMYRKVFPNATFNWYGDFNQCINVKGVSSRKELENIDSWWECFEIIENYRNAFEITEYVNKKFDMNMIPIGIKGSVNEVPFSFEVFDISSLDDRIACIVKDSNPIIEDLTKDERFNNITEADGQIVRGKINIIPISLAKGLEFEKVYVIPEKMSKNEEYVSYTRALNELYIIKK